MDPNPGPLRGLVSSSSCCVLLLWYSDYLTPPFSSARHGRGRHSPRSSPIPDNRPIYLLIVFWIKSCKKSKNRCALECTSIKDFLCSREKPSRILQKMTGVVVVISATTEPTQRHHPQEGNSESSNANYLCSSSILHIQTQVLYEK